MVVIVINFFIFVNDFEVIKKVVIEYFINMVIVGLEDFLVNGI